MRKWFHLLFIGLLCRRGEPVGFADWRCESCGELI